MINPLTIKKLMDSRHDFAESHPDFFPFMREVFGTKMEAGSEIVIAVKKPNQKEQMVHLVVNKDDQKFLKSLEDLL